MTYKVGDVAPWDIDVLLGVRGLDAVVGDGVAGPVTNLSYVAGSAGALTGTYRWTFTFVTATGETSPWPGTPNPLVLAAQRASLTNIPIGPAGTIARRIYRTKANAGEPKNTFFLAEISDNTTTTYTDNALDAALGLPVSWLPTNFGFLENSAGKVINFGDCVTVGTGASAGYASVGIGGEALASQSGSFRNVAIGIFALTALTTGVENVGIGTHAGEAVIAGIGNTFLGNYTGMVGGSVGAQNFNTYIGAGVGGNASGMGHSNVGIGYRALYGINSADQVIGFGPFAGQHANASRQIFIDNISRVSIAVAQDSGFIYGQTSNTGPQLNDMRLNATVRIGWGSPTVSQLPAASTALRGYRAYVTDASVAYLSANVGSTVAGGGANCVPVFCNGTAWVIG